jgi:cytochrome b561
MRTIEDYGPVAKLFHWSILALIATQFTVGWLMPDIKRGMQPEAMMNLHLSLGFVILALMTLRLAWRVIRGAPPPEASLPGWQRLGSELVHAGLYVVVFALTLSGWFFASMRGWSIGLFGLVPVPPLVAAGSALGRAIGQWHGPLTWVLLGLAGVHAAAALAHAFIFRDRVMQRMLPRFGRG